MLTTFHLEGEETEGDRGTGLCTWEEKRPSALPSHPGLHSGSPLSLAQISRLPSLCRSVGGVVCGCGQENWVWSHMLHVMDEVLDPDSQVLDRHHQVHVYISLPLEVGGVAEAGSCCQVHVL